MESKDWISIEEAEKQGIAKRIYCSRCGQFAGIQVLEPKPEIKKIRICSKELEPIQGSDLQKLKQLLEPYCPWCSEKLLIKIKEVENECS